MAPRTAVRALAFSCLLLAGWSKQLLAHICGMSRSRTTYLPWLHRRVQLSPVFNTPTQKTKSMPLSASRVDQSYKRLVEAEGSGAPPTTPSYGSSPAVTKFPSPSGRSPNEPPRLFDAIAAQPEPSDMHDYYSHCRGYAEVLDANARTLFLQRMMFAICTTQVVCACALTSLQDTTPDSTGKALVLISSVVSFVSGIIGFAGAWKKSTCVHAPRTTAWPRLSAHASSSAPALSRLPHVCRMALNWFFISQLWCISVVLTQFLRGQLTQSNEQIFCSQKRRAAAAAALQDAPRPPLARP